MKRISFTLGSIFFMPGSRIRLRISQILFLLTCLISGEVLAAQEVVRVGGTGIGTILIGHIVESLPRQSGVRIETIRPPLGSIGALRALAAGSIQIAVVSVPASETSRLNAELPNKRISWLRTPLVFTGHDINGSKKLTMVQVADIYAGRVIYWSDGQRIRLVARIERDSDTRLLRAISATMDDAVVGSFSRSGMIYAENDLDNQRMLENAPASFGALGLGQLQLSNSPLKPAQLDGVIPSVESLQSGAYRYEKRIYLVVAKKPSAATLAFIQVLNSPDMLKMLRRYGFISLSQN